MKQILVGLIAGIVVLWVLISSVLFTVDERQQAIITQFGAYIRTVADPGLHAKVPFVQTVYRFDKRVLATDAPPAESLTLDKKRLVVDYVARWRIKGRALRTSCSPNFAESFRPRTLRPSSLSNGSPPWMRWPMRRARKPRRSVSS
ncbi:MAG: hypothetical protein HYZ81_06620 [Nitrospinae bacterium]|nr:hypothetical protein [Nitrospinota bacterium]